MTVRNIMFESLVARKPWLEFRDPKDARRVAAEK